LAVAAILEDPGHLQDGADRLLLQGLVLAKASMHGAMTASRSRSNPSQQ